MHAQRTPASMTLAAVLALSLAPFGAQGAIGNWMVRDGLRYARRVDLGNVPVGQAASALAHLENVGTQPLWIESLTPTCGCTVADWQPRALAAGEVAFPRIGIEGEDQAGHFRHLVDIVGAAGRSLGEIVATADAYLPKEAAAPLWVDSAMADLGAYPASPRVPLALVLRQAGGDGSRALSWIVESDGVEVERGSETVAFDAGVGRLETTVPRPRSLWGGRLRLRVDGFELVVPLFGYPVPSGDRAQRAPEWEGLRIEGLANDADEPYLDFGQLQLGEDARRQLRLRNVTADTIRLARLFTSAEDDLEIAASPQALPPGGVATAVITYRGRSRPGSFRRFVHLLVGEDAPARRRIACVGHVRAPDSGGWAPDVVAVRIAVGLAPGAALTLADARGAPIARIPTLDHARYVEAISGDSRADGLLCTNCTWPAATGGLRSTRAVHDGQALEIYSVLGDEALDPAIAALALPWMDDPNNSIVRALHPAGFDPDHPTALAVVVFHDRLPLPEEAARRTRVPAVYVAAAGAAGGPIVMPSRDVLLFAPARGAAGPSSLTVYVRDSRILHWELNSPPGS